MIPLHNNLLIINSKLKFLEMSFIILLINYYESEANSFKS
jgi:hypothetical protein